MATNGEDGSFNRRSIYLITDKKISYIQDLLPLLEQIVQSERTAVYCKKTSEGEALTTLIVNKLHWNNIQCSCSEGTRIWRQKKSNVGRYCNLNRQTGDF